MTTKEPEIDCPRCLGKGFVNDADIKRLGRQLEWTSGLCGYCVGIGTVNAYMLKNKEVNDLYLTSDLPLVEREKYLSNDQEALDRAAIQEVNAKLMIGFIQNYYLNEKKSVDEIVEILIQDYGADANKISQIKTSVTNIIKHTNPDVDGIQF
ncbi:hypothetical protein [Kordia jejudonensis]|uniref:hypothetical protein n=1 Tax=Kordia jejudonensis TaxID=1348245 RepID=UPI00069A83E1|nr:hypothetical protein [Kordia jejudonensis]